MEHMVNESSNCCNSSKITAPPLQEEAAATYPAALLRMSAETVGCFSDVPTTERNAGKLQEVHNSEEVLDEEVSSSSPIIEEVAFTVATVDDPTLACLTFRTVVLGVGGNMLLTIVNTFFGYRKEPLHISAISIQIVALPLGHLMAKLLPRKSIQLVLPGLITNHDGRRWWSWGFSLNPGPFTMKEHVLITVFANTGGGAAATIVVNVVKAFYKQRMDFMPSLVFVVATQLLGYGFAGLYRKVLVEPAHMWWPHTLVQVSLFRTMHEKEENIVAKSGLNNCSNSKGSSSSSSSFSRIQFFCICLVASFAYYLLPGYFFSSLSTVSVVCFVWPHSVTAQQIGSGLNGLGIGSFALDWATVSSFRGSPLAVPLFSLVNAAVGFFLYLYVLIPIAYWGTNAYDAKTFPFFSSGSYANDGSCYDIKRILSPGLLALDLDAYNSYSKLHLSIMMAMTTAMGFAVIGAATTHFLLFHGKELVQHFYNAWGSDRADEKKNSDVHKRLMEAYAPVPQQWFVILLIGCLILAIVGAEGYKEQLQLPWWGVLLGCIIAIMFTLPFGVLVATANQAPSISILSEYLMGYLLPGKPVANLCFRIYGTSNLHNSLLFLQDLKLGQYTKIPPRSMFISQVIGSLISAITCLGTSWWLLTSIPNICNPALLPAGSPWSCPSDGVYYTSSVIWGLVGPLRTFGPLGLYNSLNWFFLAGALAPLPVWVATKLLPKSTWIRWINIPVLLMAGLTMPPASAINNIMFLTVGLIFNYLIFRHYKAWWKRYTYVLSAALDAGTAFMGIALWIFLGQTTQGGLDWWGNQGNHCPLAQCPTAPDVAVPGCPVFSRL
ncbi:unnamed protein product [Sphagnum troendelagicum]|uniref:Uncharacterized protein n=1 Tax=Sphagnum troendelagicum TaxID=128251 RepID=A0ABP0UIY1_9BRYO